MPRIPTKEEARERAEGRLAELCYDTFSTGPAALFGELENIIKAPLDIGQRICIAQQCAAYCHQVRSALEAKELVGARRLVRGARREIADLQKLTRRYQQQLRSVADGSRMKLSEQASRQCWAVYQNARQYCEQLHSLAGHPPTARLAVAENYMSEALSIVGTPFLRADFATALSILDKLLAGWGPSQGSKQGQSERSNVLSELITRLGKVFEDATNRPPKAGNRFMPFLERILAVLPPGMVPPMSDETLPTRVKRLMRSQ